MKVIQQLATRYGICSENDWQQWLDISVIKRFDKDQVLVYEGEVSKVCAFILEGSFKNVTSASNGEEKILKFSFETDFLASCESYNRQVPSEFAIVAMEPSVVMVTGNDALVELCYKNQRITNLGFILTQQLMQQHEEHLKILSLASPMARYDHVLRNQPGLLNSVSLTDLAKYLYISREALSRARSQILNA
ncbi:Crp/Fnr family transcriptional regulator [Chitinophaga lutea]|uniref:Crp/Fnr family transcriptional regulator n=1 Tax=Chitinophaga lutea TaxID=2488634 RepID=A0A3N4PX05_9BACT|nr:Crp/Fnr family transcriptional regulator [Chitinophaga lutea]RPE12005.1 Crp/Fnr family transcriptional regulator [Chitinophaga lutea]